MKMYAVSFVADGFKTLIVTAEDETAARLSVKRTFNTVIFLSVKEVG